MSRTYRRKKVTDTAILDSYCFILGGCEHFRYGITHCNMDCPFRDRKVTVSQYHRDTKEGYGWNGSAPKSYRKCLNRIKRAKSNAETRRVFLQGDYDAGCFNAWKKDAGWYYW